MYPAGADISSTVYVPFAKSVNTCGSVVVVNLTISFPAESFKANTAPANGSFVDASTFKILTTTFLGVFSTFTLTSLLLFVIVNLTGLLFKIYPFGAIVSVTV